MWDRAAVTPSMNMPGQRLSPDDRRPAELVLDATVRTLTNEFDGRLDPQEIREIVNDCFDRLVTHVPRTVHSYLLPWARNRVEHRVYDTREATLTDILLAPVNRL